MDKYYLSMEMLAVVGVYSLLWFIIGLRIGQQLEAQDNTGASGRKRTSSGGVELYIGNLAYSIDEKEIKKLFREFGKVTSVRLIKNKFNGKSKGYGFVEMADRKDSDSAIRDLNNTEVRGRRIIVNEAKTSAHA